jgi:hypothetical protein
LLERIRYNRGLLCLRFSSPLPITPLGSHRTLMRQLGEMVGDGASVALFQAVAHEDVESLPITSRDYARQVIESARLSYDGILAAIGEGSGKRPGDLRLYETVAGASSSLGGSPLLYGLVSGHALEGDESEAWSWPFDALSTDDRHGQKLDIPAEVTQGELFPMTEAWRVGRALPADDQQIAAEMRAHAESAGLPKDSPPFWRVAQTKA